MEIHGDLHNHLGLPFASAKRKELLARGVAWVVFFFEWQTWDYVSFSTLCSVPRMHLISGIFMPDCA